MFSFMFIRVCVFVYTMFNSESVFHELEITNYRKNYFNNDHNFMSIIKSSSSPVLIFVEL